MSATLLADQRQSPRLTVDIAMEFRADGAAAVPGVATNLSHGGMFVETAFAAAASGVVVTLTRPDGERVDIAATVEWATRSGMALRFGPLGPKEADAITEILEAASSR
jgi:hypothetical protein